MTPVLLRGSRLVRAVWLDPRWRTPTRLRRDALALHRPGVTISDLDGGLLVRFEADRRMDCASAPGLPFVQVGNDLWAWEPKDGEKAELPSLHQVRGCVVSTIPIATIPDAEPWRWFDVDGWEVVATKPLGAQPPALPVREATPLRAVLGKPAPGAEIAALQAELAERAQAEKERADLAGARPRRLGGLFGGGSAAGPSPGGGGLPVASGPPGLLATLLGGLFVAIFGQGGGGAPANGTKDTSPGLVHTPPPPTMSWFERIFRQMAGPMLAPMVRRQHGEYLQELLDRFDAGDLDEALKRAIPLGGEGGPSLPPLLGAPKPREDLSIRPHRSGAATSIQAPPDVMTLLKQTYERAIEKLVAAERFEDAAFVLVELLREPQRALDLLERHGKFVLAAEIAEGSRLPVETTVRLWVRAERMDRALAIARRNAAFATCLPVIERADAARGSAFRAAWAAHLAATGDPVGAVDVSWPDVKLRPLAMRWLDTALDLGGAPALRLLPRRLAEDPTSFSAVYQRVEPILRGEEPEDVELRLALAEGLGAVPSPGGRAIARPLMRALVADQAAHPALTPQAKIIALRGILDEPALVADLPSPAPVPTRTATSEASRWAFDPYERGGAPIRDVALLPRARVLVALGEAGVRLYDRNGRVLATFDEPADALVAHDAGTRAIAVAFRERSGRLARLDLQSGKAERWFDTRMHHFARTYDGSMWFVTEGDALVALDPLAERAVAVWRVTTNGPILALARGAGGIAVRVGGLMPERWRYTMPNLRLQERVYGPNDPWSPASLGTDGSLDEVRTLGGGASLPWRRTALTAAAPYAALLPSPEPEFKVEGVQNASEHLLVRGRGAAGAVLAVYRAEALVGSVSAAMADAIVARSADGRLVVGDDRGRLMVVDLKTGAVVGRWRV